MIMFYQTIQVKKLNNPKTHNSGWNQDVCSELVQAFAWGWDDTNYVNG